MTTYKIERMDATSYNNYMSGSNCYSVEHLYINANSKAEAIEKASQNGYFVNKGYVREEGTAEDVKKTVDKVQKEIEELRKALVEKEEFLKKIS